MCNGHSYQGPFCTAAFFIFVNNFDKVLHITDSVIGYILSILIFILMTPVCEFHFVQCERSYWYILVKKSKLLIRVQFSLVQGFIAQRV